jgi:ribose/xylose/arabinose/galactoside ABC-type transport system permease subunit
LPFTALSGLRCFTKVGRRLYAVGGNPEAARLSGINVTKYRLMAFVFCSMSGRLCWHPVSPADCGR